MSRMNDTLISQVQNLEKANNIVLLDGKFPESPCPSCNGAGYRVRETQIRECFPAETARSFSVGEAVLCPTCRGQRSEA